MRNITITVIGIMLSLLLAKYNPHMSRKLLAEYVTSAYLSLRYDKLANSDEN